MARSRNGKGGAAHVAPPSRKPRSARKLRNSDPTVSGIKGLAHNPLVLNWVREHTRRRVSSKQIVAASVAGAEGWPVPGEALSDGSLASCRAAIFHLEAAGVSWPLGAPPKKPEAGRLLHELHGKRRKAGDALDRSLYQARIEIIQMVGTLEGIDFPKLGIRDAEADMVADIYEDLVRLSVWTDASVTAVAAEIEDLKKLELIRKLRDTKGRTPEEAKTAMRLADRLESKRLMLV